MASKSLRLQRAALDHARRVTSTGSCFQEQQVFRSALGRHSFASATPGAADTSLLLRQEEATALLQQSSSIFARHLVRAPQIVDALEQLAANARGASAQEIHVLTEARNFRQLLAELTKHLPRDAGEKVSWEPAWTARTMSALKDLRAQSLDPQLSLRLGNALLQAPETGLRTLLHRAQSFGDDYSLWVLGTELEELCESSELGELALTDLVSLLHLLAHPAVQQRVPARSSPHVLRHVQYGLGSCEPPELAKLLQAYSDVPSIVSEIHEALMSRASLSSTSLPELTVVASSLLDEPRLSALSLAVLQRLEELSSAELSLEELELGIACALGARASLPGQTEVLGPVVGRLGAQAVKAKAKPEVLARLLTLAFATKGDWIEAAALQLAPRSGELLPGTLAELLVALAAAEVALPPDFLESLVASAVALAPAWPLKDFCLAAQAMAQAGLAVERFLDAGDVEARLGIAPEAHQTAQLAWAMAAAGFESPVAWALVQAQVQTAQGLAAPEQALLLEALSAQAAMHGDIKDTAETQRSAWRKSWEEHRAQPRSAHLTIVEQFLRDLGFDKAKADVKSQDGLYVMPFLLPEENVIIDLLPAGRHSASQQVPGDVALRHEVWSALGYSVLAIPDSVWPRLAAEAEGTEQADQSNVESALEQKQRAWLQRRLELLSREDLIQKAGLEAEIVGELRNVTLGEEGLNLDALRRLAQAPAELQKEAVRKYSRSLDAVKPKSPSAWMIGILRNEREGFDARKAKEEAAEKEAAEAKRKEAAAKKLQAKEKRPDEGWEHDAGRPLEQVKVRELLQGVVTNIFKDRVWVNVGLAKDATFIRPRSLSNEFQVGKKVSKLRVASVDVEKGWVEVSLPRSMQQKARLNERGAKPGPAAPKRHQEATSPRPRSGWQHGAGQPLVELQVGSLVSGQVTNMLRGRVWVNIGAAADASFRSDAQFNVGDKLENLRIRDVNLDKGTVLVSAPGDSAQTEPSQTDR